MTTRKSAEGDFVDRARHVRQGEQGVRRGRERNASFGGAIEQCAVAETVSSQGQAARLSVPMGEGEGAEQARDAPVAPAFKRAENKFGVADLRQGSGREREIGGDVRAIVQPRIGGEQDLVLAEDPAFAGPPGPERPPKAAPAVRSKPTAARRTPS